MTSFEVFTAEELISLFVEICSEVECIVEDEDEYITGGTSLICDAGGLEFTCFLLGEEPFWNGLSLTSSRPAPPNPLHFCNRFNSGPHLSRVYQIQPLDDDDDFDEVADIKDDETEEEDDDDFDDSFDKDDDDDDDSDEE